MGSRILEVEHRTAYRYAAPVEQSWQLARLQPRELPWQRVLAHGLTIHPEPDWRELRIDSFGNAGCAFALHGPHQLLEVTATSRVQVRDQAPTLRMAGDESPAAADDPVSRAHFTGPSPQVPLLAQARRYARSSFGRGRALIDSLHDLAGRIHHDFTFDATATTVTTALHEVLATRRGVCQDFAHLMIACLRTQGIAARYVSGYILTTPPPGQPRLVGADASHAWVSAWCPQLGWIDMDPTNNRRTDRDFVTLAWGRDFSDVSPLRGVILGGGEQALTAEVTVTPLAA